MSGLEPVPIAAAVVLVLNAVESFIEFNNRFVNAVVDTVLFVSSARLFILTTCTWDSQELSRLLRPNF
jgi:hypothetical protein